MRSSGPAFESSKSVTPSTPATGFVKLYPKSDGRWYLLDEAGVEKRMAPCHVGTTAPTSPAVGDLWIDTT